MNTLPYLTKDKRVPYRFYFCVVFGLILSIMFYGFPDALDIIRYYEGAEQAVAEFKNVAEYALFWFESHLDFIYPVSLFLALKIGVSMDVITVFYMTLYYVAIFEVLRKQFHNVRIPRYLLFYVTMFAPFVWVISISRNLAAIAFFYIAISCILSEKKIKSILWLIVSLFTHISMLMYIPIIVIALFLNKRIINNKLLGLGIIVSLVLSFIVPSQLLNLILMVIEGGDTRYAVSYGGMESNGALVDSSIGYGDKLPIVFCLVYSVSLIFLNKKRDFMYWMLYFLTIMLAFFISSSLMFTNRIIMLMTLFVVYNTYKIMSDGNKISKQYITSFSIIGCLIVMLHFYSYRPYFSL